MRRVAVPLMVALVLSVAAPAHADVGAVGGLGQLTATPGCTNGFQLPIAASTTDGALWTFTITGVQVNCIITYGVPWSFTGEWNPVAPPCVFATGYRCPASTDPARAGYFLLGAVPQTRVLTQTIVGFCLRGNCYQGNALVERT